MARECVVLVPGLGSELGFGFGFGFGFGLGFGFDPHLHPVPAGSARRLHRRERPPRGALQQVPAVLRERRHERSALRPHGRQVLGQANQARLGLLAATDSSYLDLHRTPYCTSSA